MEKEPLLPYSTSPSPRLRTVQCLFSLPEDDEISVSLPLTPSKLKNQLIFGPSTSTSNTPPNFESFINMDSTPNNSSPEEQPPTPRLQQQQLLFLQQIQPNPNPNPNPISNPSSPSSWLLDPNFQWIYKTSMHRSKTAPAMAVINDLKNEHDGSSNAKPNFAVSQPIIQQAFVLLVLYLSFGVVIYWFNRKDFMASETHPVVDALYFCIVTMCTIGYGDITPNTTATKLFSVLFVLIGFGFIDILLTGMVSYVLDLQESYLLRAVKGDGGGNGGEKKDSPGFFLIDVKKGRMRIRMKVALALGVVVLCIGIGAMVMHYVERLDWMDSLYLSVMSVTTVGYGDRAFQSLPGRIFASVWLLVSTLAVARAFLYLAEARVDKRQRRMVKWVLGQDMTVAEFLAADIDNNGFVSKSEYVVYKLKEMGKVSEKDIMQICQKFDRLDAGNCGKITLVDLMESHQK